MELAPGHLIDLSLANIERILNQTIPNGGEIPKDACKNLPGFLQELMDSLRYKGRPYGKTGDLLVAIKDDLTFRLKKSLRRGVLLPEELTPEIVRWLAGTPAAIQVANQIHLAGCGYRPGKLEASAQNSPLKIIAELTGENAPISIISRPPGKGGNGPIGIIAQPPGRGENGPIGIIAQPPGGGENGPIGIIAQPPGGGENGPIGIIARPPDGGSPSSDSSGRGKKRKGWGSTAVLIAGAIFLLILGGIMGGRFVPGRESVTTDQSALVVIQSVTLTNTTTSSLTPSRTITVTRTATGTFTPTPVKPTFTPTPVPAVFYPSFNAYCRSGDDTSFPWFDIAMKGSAYPIDGRNFDNTWLRIMITNSRGCWVLASSGSASLDTAKLRVLADVPTLTPTPVPYCRSFTDQESCDSQASCRWIKSLITAPYCGNK